MYLDGPRVPRSRQVGFAKWDASGMQSSDDDKGEEEAAGIDCNAKTAIKNPLVTFEECAEEGKMLRLREKLICKFHLMQLLLSPWYAENAIMSKMNMVIHSYRLLLRIIDLPENAATDTVCHCVFAYIFVHRSIIRRNM